MAVGIGAPIRLSQPAPTPEVVAALMPPAPVVALDAPADADPCTSCGRAELLQAYDVRAGEQRAMDAQVLAQVAATYAASRPG